MNLITDYTRSEYREINRDLLSGVSTTKAAELIEVVSSLPASPGVTYRTFWVDEVAEYVERLKSSKTVTFAAFSSASRLQAIANRFNGNVKLMIHGKTGRDIAPMSDKPSEQETLYLPALTCQIVKVRTIKVGGKVWSVEVELIEI